MDTDNSQMSDSSPSDSHRRNISSTSNVSSLGLIVIPTNSNFKTQDDMLGAGGETFDHRNFDETGPSPSSCYDKDNY